MPKTEDEQRTPVNWKDVPTNQAGITADRIVGHLDLRTFDRASFDTDDFRCEWAHGEPLLVRDVTGPMHHPWGPDALQSRYGRDHCLIVRSDVEIAEPKQVSVGDFFATFGQDDTSKQAALGRGHWKLKDWPPSAEFKAEFPELYDDFNRVVPAPDYTTREGVLNLGSCYPTGVIQPDLGPKMYNAWPGSEAPGGNGTTRLHMDIADAVNIMLHASPPTGDDVPEEHRPGVAAWDIFRAQDADKLRAFLRKEYSHIDFRDDPIHIQRFFIDAKQRVKLYQEYGVRSWRIYQKAGEAVFIPAGCAHQVCNLADCIKVAVDFVSPQNVDRCFKLTAEFRELVQDYKKAWKEDVLSLRTTLWYAWCTYRQMDGQGPNVWAKQRREVKKEGDSQMQRITRRVLQAQ
jgi:lysine-specific demethylase 3